VTRKHDLVENEWITEQRIDFLPVLRGALFGAGATAPIAVRVRRIIDKRLE
jgi:hypothetical protein